MGDLAFRQVNPNNKKRDGDKSMTLHHTSTRNVADQLVQLPPYATAFTGEVDEKIRLVKNQILEALDYTKMVDFFRNQSEVFAAGEFWGKIMRASCMTYEYCQDAELMQIMEESVDDLLSIQRKDGCISNFKDENQPYHSDLWERKYLLLGMEWYYTVTRDERVLQAMIRLLDFTISQVGHSPKVRIVDTGWAFEGIESSSILEPVLWLYQLTGLDRYIDFAQYIVDDEGACKRENIFEAAYQGRNPKDIGNNGNPLQSIAKAYEMMSCFEGLVEYCRVTGKEQHKQAALNLYQQILEQEINIIGSGGAAGPYNLGPGTGEQWNGTAYEQTNPDIGRGNETCVTVTWMKFCYQLLRLTGDPTIADQIERSAVNALMGALKPEGNYFEYYPKLHGVRSMEQGFGYKVGDFNLTCCSANGPTGLALLPMAAVMGSESGPVINLYYPGVATVSTPSKAVVRILVSTEYPRSGRITIAVNVDESEVFTVKLRIPQWSHVTTLSVNGQPMTAPQQGTYAEITRTWSAEDIIVLNLDMRCRVIDALQGSNRAGDRYKALVRGPVVLCRDRRVGTIDERVDILVDSDGFVDLEPVPDSPISRHHYRVPSRTGYFDVIDYVSAGATWDDRSEFQVWLPY